MKQEMKNIYILPTDKPSCKLQKTKHGNFFLSNEIKLYSDCINQHIYITSDKPIKDYDWYISSVGKLLQFTGRNVLGDKFIAPKVILTTDQDLIKDGVQAIDDNFLEWFVKNPNCEKVEVIYDYFQINQDNPVTRGSTALVQQYKIIIPKEAELDKLKKQFQIKANEALELNSKIGNFGKPKEEPKQETLEEAAEEYVIDESFLSGYKEECERAFINGAKWMQERMYSEEEMKFAIKTALFYWTKNANTETEAINDIFEQFKKKQQ